MHAEAHEPCHRLLTAVAFQAVQLEIDVLTVPARFNSALDITPAGFTEGAACALPHAVAVQEAERTSA